MYILKCEADNTFCLLPDKDVLCDDDKDYMEKGETVSFMWKSKCLEGEVIEYSVDEKYLNKQFKLLEKSKNDIKSSPSVPSVESKKRKITPRTSWSPENYLLHNKRSKKSDSPVDKFNHAEKTTAAQRGGKAVNSQVLKIIDSRKRIKNSMKVVRDLDKNNSSYEDSFSADENENEHDSVENPKLDANVPKKNIAKTTSPTKDELIKLLAKERMKTAKLEELQSLKKSEKSITQPSIVLAKISSRKSTEKGDKEPSPCLDVNCAEENQKPDEDIIVEESIDHTQLFGKNWPEKMKLLKDGIYCIETVHMAALGSSHRASHVVRRLLEGVFKREALIASTVTGSGCRALGKKKPDRKRLDATARKAIIDYAKAVAKAKGWPEQTEKELNVTVTQRLGELRRDHESEQNGTKMKEENAEGKSKNIEQNE